MAASRQDVIGKARLVIDCLTDFLDDTDSYLSGLSEADYYNHHMGHQTLQACLSDAVTLRRDLQQILRRLE